MSKEGLQKARDILDNIRKPKVPSDELVSIVQEISESNEGQDHAQEKDKIAALPASEAHT